jgi:4-hydroxy-L-threonine phosphate dehydrogenase PdxA
MPHVRPVVALTLGDPASVGPEVVVKALAEGGLHEGPSPSSSATRAS